MPATKMFEVVKRAEKIEQFFHSSLTVGMRSDPVRR